MNAIVSPISFRSTNAAVIAMMAGMGIPQAEPAEIAAPAEAVAVVESPAVVDVQPEAEPAPAEEPAAEPVQPRYFGTAAVDRAALASAIETVKLAVDKRNSVPILDNAKLVADGAGGLAMVGTNCDIEIAVSLAASRNPAFGVTLPAHLLADILKRALDGSAGEKITIEAPGEGAAAVLEFERGRYTLNALDVADFPTLQTGDFSHAFFLSGEALRDMLAAVKTAISKEETRYYLNGVYMHVVDTGNRQELRTVATDGHRLYVQDIDAPAESFGMPGVIIPRYTIDILGKLLKGKACPEIVLVETSERHIRVSYGAVTVTSNLIDGHFPDYQRVIPTMNDIVGTFDGQALLDAVSAVSVISSERGRAFKLAMVDGKATVRVVNPDSGSAECSFACSLAKAGEAAPSVEIGFNAGYMTALMADAMSFGGGEIVAEFSDPGSPTVFRGASTSWRAVLMPMRV